MPRQKGQGESLPSEDIGWKFGTPVENSRHHINCKFCGGLIKGGITRFKEHLAHVSGNVRGCPSVSREVMQEMNKHLKESKDKRKDKQKRKEELQAQLIGRGDERENYVDLAEGESDSDAEFTMARRESIRIHEWEERERYERATGASGSQTRAGGSSVQGDKGKGLTGLLRRTLSVRDSSAGGSGRQWINPNAPDARLRAMDPVLQKSKSAKQPKINAGRMKKLREKLGDAVSKFMLYNRLPFHVADSLWTQPMLDVAAEVGKGVKGPSSYEVAEVYLPDEHAQMVQWIKSFKGIWEERGVTIMMDGWSSLTRLHIINFLVYCNRGTIFHKSIDASNVRSRNAEYYFSLMDQMVEEIGEKYVVQIVTDNESAMKAGGRMLMEKRKHLYWTACAAHCIDLMLEDICKKKSVAKVIEDAKMITTFIYNHTYVYDLMKVYTEGKNLLRPAITRFATNFLALESILKFKQQLRAMFTSDEWKNSRWGKAKSGIPYDVKKLILGKDFWQKVTEICKVQEPLVKVLRLVDGDEKPTMGFIYEAMDRAKLAISRDVRYHDQYWDIIDRRWGFQLHHDLHSAGYFFNPQYQYGGNSSRETMREVLEGVKKVISRLEPDLDNQVRALNQLLLFRDKEDSFGTPTAQRAWSQTNPAEWWILYGTCAPELQQIAVKVLSQTTSSSNCERNWSTFSLIHTKTRNRLKYLKLQKLVFITYNMRLKLRHINRKAQEEIDSSFNPINLDYIFEEDDPLNPWLEEREAPLLDGQDNNDWLNDDDDDAGGDGAGTSGTGSQRPQSSQNKSRDSSSSPSPTQSGDGGGLTLSDNEGDGGDDARGGNNSAYSGQLGHNEGSFGGRIGLHDYPPGFYMGDSVAPMSLRHSSPDDTRGGRVERRAPRHRQQQFDDVESSSSQIARTFENFGFAESSNSSGVQYFPHPLELPQQYPPSYGYNSSNSDAQSFSYPPGQSQQYPPSYGNDSSYNSGALPLFPYLPGPPYQNPNVFPHTLMSAPHLEHEQQEGSGGFFDFLNPSGWRDDNSNQEQGQQEDAPRHSFWW